MDEMKIEYTSENRTYVFWFMDDYPVPVDAIPHSIFSSIEAAITQMGFENLNEIRAYADKVNCETREWCDAGIIPSSASGGDNSATVEMARDMILIASMKPLEIVNFVAIVKQNPEKHELLRVFKALKTRKFPVIIVEPPAQDNIFVSVEALVDSAYVFGQGKLSSIRPQSSTFDSDSEEEMQEVEEEVAFRWRKNYPYYHSDDC